MKIGGVQARFVLDAAESPFNVVEPGKRPRVTLTPSMALEDGAPYLAFAVQGGDGQEQETRCSSSPTWSSSA